MMLNPLEIKHTTYDGREMRCGLTQECHQLETACTALHLLLAALIVKH